jgi:hypothetical protein
MHESAPLSLRHALAISYEAPIEEIIGIWKQGGLPIDGPGFYNHPQYIRTEQAQPGYINTYARYVRDRSYSDGYLYRSESIIEAATSMLGREVAADGRPNLCVTVSKVLSKMLERLNVWNYVVVGTFLVSFRRDGRWQTHAFYSFDMRPVDAAHAWVVAPPFRIIDLTLRQQKYAGPAPDHLPDTVVSQYTFGGDVAAREVCAPALLLGLKLKGFSDEDVLDRVYGAFKQFSAVFPPEVVQSASATLKYIPTRIITPEGDLEQLGNLSINGKTPKVLFQKLRSRVGGM